MFTCFEFDRCKLEPDEPQEGTSSLDWEVSNEEKEERSRLEVLANARQVSAAAESKAASSVSAVEVKVEEEEKQKKDVAKMSPAEAGMRYGLSPKKKGGQVPPRAQPQVGRPCHDHRVPEKILKRLRCRRQCCQRLHHQKKRRN